MTDDSRRDFLKKVGVAAGAGTLAPGVAAEGLRSAESEGPFVRDGDRQARPVSISSSNGLRAVDEAMRLMRQGTDTLEAAVSGVNIVEEDPEDMSVGYGGLPNYLGEVQLDAQVWHGPTRGAGAVGALEGYIHPSRVAMAVMRYTDHVLLVGEGAADFADEFGFEEEDLLTDRARRTWLEWRAELSDRDDYLTPEQSGEMIESFQDPGGRGATTDTTPGEMGWRHSHDGHRPWGTIHCSTVNRDGEISATTTTSGLFFKVPGRVGDSPLPGCGCYADNDVGAAGSTGRGEAVVKTLGTHTIVEAMRRGVHPQDACVTALERVVDWTVEDRLLNERGRPNFGLNYYAVDKEGEHGGASLYAGASYAVHDGEESRLVDSAYVFEGEDE